MPQKNHDRPVFDVRITGRVQGVGFRAFAERIARELGVDGFVENLPDGSVHAIVAGNRRELESFLDALDRGPTAARVDRVESRETDREPPEGKFSVRR